MDKKYPPQMEQRISSMPWSPLLPLARIQPRVINPPARFLEHWSFQPRRVSRVSAPQLAMTSEDTFGAGGERGDSIPISPMLRHQSNMKVELLSHVIPFSKPLPPLSKSSPSRSL